MCAVVDIYECMRISRRSNEAELTLKIERSHDGASAGGLRLSDRHQKYLKPELLANDHCPKTDSFWAHCTVTNRPDEAAAFLPSELLRSLKIRNLNIVLA